MLNSDLKKVNIWAANPLLGTSTFLLIEIPKNWFIKPTPEPADIEYVNEVEGVRWVSSGSISLILVINGRKTLGLRIRAGKLKEKSEKSNSGEIFKVRDIEVGSHRAKLVFTRRRGKRFIFFGGEKIKGELTCSLNCEDTKRRIDIELTGDFRDISEYEEEITSSLKRIKCHEYSFP